MATATKEATKEEKAIGEQARADALSACAPMRVTLDREVFAERLGFVCAIVPTKSPREVYTMAMVEAVDALHGGPMLRVTGQNGDVSIVVTMEEVDVQLAGRALVNAARLRSMIGEMTGQRAAITLEPQKGNLRIEDEGARFILRADDPELFPPPPPKGETMLRVPAAFLAAALDRTAFAVHQERTRYAMNGVAFEVSPTRAPGKLSIVATDGKRAAWVEVEAPDAREKMESVVPGAAIGAMGRIFARWPDETIEMAPVTLENAAAVSTSTAMQFRTARACVTARLLEGAFPPWRDLPTWGAQESGALEVSRAALNQAIRQVAIVADKITNVSRWKLTRQGLTMGLRQSDTGDAADVDVPGTFTGEDIETGYQSEFVADALRSMGETVRLGFVKLAGASALRVVAPVPGVPDGVRAEWRYIVMPINQA